MSVSNRYISLFLRLRYSGDSVFTASQGPRRTSDRWVPENLKGTTGVDQICRIDNFITPSNLRTVSFYSRMTHQRLRIADIFRKICKISPIATVVFVSVSVCVCGRVCYFRSHSSYLSENQNCKKWRLQILKFDIEWRHCENCTSLP